MNGSNVILIRAKVIVYEAGKKNLLGYDEVRTDFMALETLKK